jgi:hypothetical protein
MTGWRWRLPWAIVLAAVLVYPLAVVADGGPRFPSRAECVHRASADGALEVVFGRFDNANDASALLKRVLAAGFEGSQIEPDGCGLLKVAVHGIPTLKVGDEVLGEARSVGLEPTLEQVVS